MDASVVIYGKQSGEVSVPLTVRIEWLPDGNINPMMCWTPDGSCMRIVSHSVGVSLALLKDRGKGIRYKVRAEIIDTTEFESELLNTQFDMYLYLEDKRFCEKNIIDERYSHAGKEYIPVILDVFPDGDYELVSFWACGNRYAVEKTIDIARRGSFIAGGTGIRHKVEARLVNNENDNDPDPNESVMRVAALYWELNKWFVPIAKQT